MEELAIRVEDKTQYDAAMMLLESAGYVWYGDVLPTATSYQETLQGNVHRDGIIIIHVNKERRVLSHSGTSSTKLSETIPFVLFLSNLIKQIS
jgi:hypothetical protein